MKKYIYKIKFFILAQVIFNILATICLAIMPYLSKLLFDSVAGISNYKLKSLIAMYIACVIGHLFFTYIETICTWKQALKFESSLKNDFFRAIINYSYKRFSSKNIGEYISLQSNEITQLEMDYLTPFVDLIKSINILIIYGIMLFMFVDWRISIIIFVLSIISVLIGPNLTSKKLSARRKKYLNKMGEYFSKIKDLLEGFKLIQNKTRNNIFLEQEKVLKETIRYRFHYGKLKTLAGTINEAFVLILHIISFALVGYLLFKHEITAGVAVATFGYLDCFIDPIQSLIYDINSINSTKSIKNKVLDFIRYDNVPSKLISRDTFDFNGSNIKFDNVTVKYNTFSLDNFSYTFEKCKKYAIIGHSGSGKSTIVNALMKYVELDSGNILINGENIKYIDTSNLICCINQNEHIFATDFNNNVTLFGSYPLNNISSLIRVLDKKMFKSIKEKSNCQLLSGGEKQVLSIIRACLTDAPIYIMDEVFSAADMNTKQKLQKFLMSIDNKTIIMITHELSEHLSDFDEILLMENGKLVKSGSYKEILKSESFAKLRSVS
ncbi:lipid A export ATP-binding/permease protein MsbA [Clostridium tepidiprofundi DSM 19306]|uniref:Lipid A export ATP-binding/permease protein MsbA n=1 Tax=Clostridium tepidiprofundi DSM 19306 TaxID=1121338 RepID=A0A151B078_9CLOT|nr:ABC transporter ATP-binding protein [Clostridium tepidiprofundi]KYH33296.1 lipid A export ATP-binding/permease protein MsbA [Clostridium tepidiprofundi DSM 19306]